MGYCFFSQVCNILYRVISIWGLHQMGWKSNSIILYGYQWNSQNLLGLKGSQVR